jgi:hypothetical protein
MTVDAARLEARATNTRASRKGAELAKNTRTIFASFAPLRENYAIPRTF